jgi:large subunit ribosomal protein L9
MVMRKQGVDMGRMKVLLTQDVANVGLAGEIQSVAGGYARNYLMPRGYAILATKGALKQADEIRQAGIRRRAAERANAEAQAAVISQHKLLFAARTGENNRLYGSVTSADIAEELSKAVGFEVDRRRIQLDHPIRDLGIYDIELRLVPEVAAKFKVAVVREGEGWAEAEARAATPVDKGDIEEARENDFE